MKHEPEIWKNAYEADGFLIVPDLLDAVTLSELTYGMAKITASPRDLPAHLRDKIFFEADHVVNNRTWYGDSLAPEDCGESVRQIEDIGLFDTVFTKMIWYPALLDVLEALFQSTEFSFTLMTGRPKVARVGNGVRNGAFHRDTPDQNYTSANTIESFLCIDEMNAENGPTTFIRGSHKVSDEVAKKPCWMNVDSKSLDLKSIIKVRCPAGSGIFFSSKIIHAAGHNRSGSARRTINIEWAGPGVLSTSAVRFAWQGLRPLSKDPLFEKQMRMTFPESA